MSKLWKTEADLRAEKAAAEKKDGTPAKIDNARKTELDGHLKRLGAVTAVFQMRADSVPVPSFRRISELMDIYIAGGLRAIGEGQDFINAGIKLSDEETRDLHKLMREIFNVDAGSDAGPDKSEKK